MIYIIPIGAKATANNEFKGLVISVSIRKTHIVYELQKTTKEGAYTAFFADWEITSSHKKKSIVYQLME